MDPKEIDALHTHLQNMIGALGADAPKVIDLLEKGMRSPQ